MMRPYSTAPRRLLTIALLYGFVVLACVLMIVVEQPWLGLQLHYDAAAGGAIVTRATGSSAEIPPGSVLVEVASDTGTLAFTALDFVTEPDGSIESYTEYERFLARQELLAGIMRSPNLLFSGKNGETWVVMPAQERPMSTLPVEFWVQLAVGFIAWAISAGVWAFRPRELSARILLLSGWSTLVFAPLAGVYTTRELALGAPLFRCLSDLNFLGGSLFAASMVALLLCYPRRLALSWAGPSVILVHVLWFILQQFGAFESMMLARRLLVAISLVATLVLAWLQWRQTRKDPLGRAALRWFLLSWILGSGLFGFLILVPQMFGVDTSALQGYGFLLFLLVYGGLAFGILRFRLFGLDEWWVRIITWIGALLLLLALDLLFLFKLHWSTGLSLSISLAICGLLWLPLRGYLSSRLIRPSIMEHNRVFKQLLDMGLSPDSQTKLECWKQCLTDSFHPLRIEMLDDSLAEPRIEKDGLALVLPQVEGLSALRLEYAQQGSALFSPRDVTAASEMVEMLRHVVASRDAYDRGVHVERTRIARDIHDNLGSQILAALHSSGEARRNELLRGMLTDLRGIVNDAHHGEASAADALAELRFELGGLLESCHIQFHWHVDEALSGEQLPQTILAALRPLLREAVGNAIKHASASAVGVSFELEDSMLILKVSDNGSGFDSYLQTDGHGLGNLRGRMAELGGEMKYRGIPDSQGTCLQFEIPLQHSEPRP